MCVRCGKPNDILLHSYWACSDNFNSIDKCVKDSQPLCWEAVHEHAQGSALRFGCVMPRATSVPKPLQIRRGEAMYEIDGPFLEIMRMTGKVGADGAGGALGKFPIIRTVGAGCSVIIFHPTIECLILGKRSCSQKSREGKR